MTFETVSEIKSLFRKQKYDEAVSMLISQLDNLSKFIIDLNKKGELDPQINSYNELLKEIQNAIVVKDSIKLCDIIQYILYPFYVEIKTLYGSDGEI